MSPRSAPRHESLEATCGVWQSSEIAWSLCKAPEAADGSEKLNRRCRAEKVWVRGRLRRRIDWWTAHKTEVEVEDVAGALAESYGRRAPYTGTDRIEHHGRGRRSMQTAGRADEGGLGEEKAAVENPSGESSPTKRKPLDPALQQCINGKWAKNPKQHMKTLYQNNKHHDYDIVRYNDEYEIHL